MSEVVTVERRYRGPESSVNGGYACGVVAGLVGGSCVEVTLRSPPPLETPLTVERGAGGQVSLRLKEQLLAEGAPAQLELAIPESVTLAQARAAQHEPPVHAMPQCFVCGPQREPGDGLRLFAAPVTGRDVVAAAYAPQALDCEDGVVRPEVQWSLLDCPTGFALIYFATRWIKNIFFLGRLSGVIEEPLRQGNEYVSMSWVVGTDGRKGFAGTALFDENGRRCAFSRATWIQVKT